MLSLFSLTCMAQKLTWIDLRGLARMDTVWPHVVTVTVDRCIARVHELRLRLFASKAKRTAARTRAAEDASRISAEAPMSRSDSRSVCIIPINDIRRGFARLRGRCAVRRSMAGREGVLVDR